MCFVWGFVYDSEVWRLLGIYVVVRDIIVVL